MLGEGLRHLYENNEPIPDSVKQLRRQLQAAGFRYVRSSHAGRVEIRLDEDSYYRYHDGKNRTHRFEVVKPSGKRLPPSLTAVKLTPQPYIQWSLDESGGLKSTIQYRLMQPN